MVAYRDICGISGDIMGIIGDHTHNTRLEIWREQHKENFGQVLVDFNKAVESNYDHDNSVFDHEIQQYAENVSTSVMGVDWDREEEITDEFTMELDGMKWIDGRTIVWTGAWDTTYTKELINYIKYHL